ncbi:hypothetical protein IEO21_03161 [Rhodonia placenta]|uniref:Uncharacterized protein n=1 Tax=Rhodonia placenta TaxID=104341 RepID=A0A8H7P699_9APHY|nr:hypothetical protein IEO21_03161 [Postia placenta]
MPHWLRRCGRARRRRRSSGSCLRTSGCRVRRPWCRASRTIGAAGKGPRTL